MDASRQFLRCISELLVAMASLILVLAWQNIEPSQQFFDRLRNSAIRTGTRLDRRCISPRCHQACEKHRIAPCREPIKEGVLICVDDKPCECFRAFELNEPVTFNHVRPGQAD